MKSLLNAQTSKRTQTIYTTVYNEQKWKKHTLENSFQFEFILNFFNIISCAKINLISF